MLTRAQIISYVLAKIGISDTAAANVAGTFLDMRHAMIWNEADWRQTRYQDTVAVTPGTQDYTLNGAFEFPKAARWDGVYEVPIINDVAALQRNPAGYDTSGPVLAIVPLARTSAGACQIRLLQKPTVAGTLLVIGKKKLTTLATDDEPPIPGEDIALCEYVTGDLYEWLRQLQKAQYFFQKGGALVEKMKEIESAQAGELRQIVPTPQILEGEGGGYLDSGRPLG